MKFSFMRNKLLSAAIVVSLSGGALLPMTVHGALLSDGQATAAELQAQIQALLSQITALQAQLASNGTSVNGSSYNYINDLTMGSKGADVTALQNFLGVSPATGYFGSLTKAALAKWQAANSVSPAAGYFGARTRAKMSAMGGTTTGGTTTSGTTTPAPTSVPASIVSEELKSATVTPSVSMPLLSNPFESTLKIEFTFPSLTLSSYGDKVLTEFKLNSTEKIGIS